MNAIEPPKQEHGKAKSTFQVIEPALTEQRAALWRKRRPELELRETHAADWLIEDIDHLDPSDSQWLLPRSSFTARRSTTFAKKRIGSDRQSSSAGTPRDSRGGAAGQRRASGLRLATKH